MDSRSIISVDHLTKKFGSLTAVDDISFSVPAGGIFAFLGPNGAGKTTTIKMLTTLLRPASGTITLNGINVLSDPEAARRQFGIVFQDQSLDDELTVRENLEFHGVLYDVPKPLRRQRIDELLHFVELYDRRNSLVKTFSGGMKRRLEIARSLLHHPPVIFLDEPTQGLDPQTRNHIWSYLVKLNSEEGITLFFTTHYLEEAEKTARQIVIIDEGKIITQGSPEEIRVQNHAATLEDAFLSLTGHGIREEEGSAAERMRQRRSVWHR